MEKQIELDLDGQVRPTGASDRATTACVYHGDAFDLFGQLPPGSVDLLITSPPYWGHRDYGLGHNWELFNDIPTVREIGAATPGYDWYRKRGGVLGLEPYPEWFVSHLAEILDRAAKCLKAEGSMYYEADGAEPRAGDVVVVNVVPGEAGHAATFPHDLIEPRIRTSSPPGGMVLDPFCGTGRALEVARALGRHTIGFDAQRKFAELTESKLHGKEHGRRRQLRQ